MAKYCPIYNRKIPYIFCDDCDDKICLKNDAEVKTYNKLVRDKIPDIIKQNGENPKYKIIHEDKEYISVLLEKLEEEISEFKEAYATEELADILEVVYGLANAINISNDNLNKIATEKREQRGSFSKRIYLLETEKNRK